MKRILNLSDHVSPFKFISSQYYDKEQPGTQNISRSCTIRERVTPQGMWCKHPTRMQALVVASTAQSLDIYVQLYRCSRFHFSQADITPNKNFLSSDYILNIVFNKQINIFNSQILQHTKIFFRKKRKWMNVIRH